MGRNGFFTGNSGTGACARALVPAPTSATGANRAASAMRTTAASNNVRGAPDCLAERSTAYRNEMRQRCWFKCLGITRCFGARFVSHFQEFAVSAAHGSEHHDAESFRHEFKRLINTGSTFK